MSDLDDLEGKLKQVKQAKEVEFAITLCDYGVANKGIVYRIAAESDYGVERGGAERSVNMVFTEPESAEIFTFVKGLLANRLVTIRRDLGL